MQDLLPTPNAKTLHRVVASVTPISMTHMNKAEVCSTIADLDRAHQLYLPLEMRRRYSFP